MASASVPLASSEGLADVLFTRTQKRLFALLYGYPERSYSVSELIALASSGRGSVQRELARLEQSGLVTTERHGNQKHCRANPDTAIFEELSAIVQKTSMLKKGD